MNRDGDVALAELPARARGVCLLETVSIGSLPQRMRQHASAALERKARTTPSQLSRRDLCPLVHRSTRVDDDDLVGLEPSEDLGL